MSLDQYLHAIQQRTRWRDSGRWALLLAITLSTLIGALAWAFVMTVPGAGTISIARWGLLLVAAGVVAGWLMRRAALPQAVVLLETRLPALDGRLLTWFDTSRRGDVTPIAQLLEADVVDVVNRQAPGAVIRNREIFVPLTAAVAAVVALALLVTGGTHPFQLAAQRIVAGDTLSNAAPRIVVIPGDVVIPRGADVVIEVNTSGFAARNVTMNALFERSPEFETAPMSRTADDGFAFVFVGVTEDVDYYIGTNGLNSDRYVIRVADLPRVTDVETAYEFPEWTGLTPESRETGEVTALPGTQVSFSALTNSTLSQAVLVVNGVETDARAGGQEITGTFTVTEAGNWYVAVYHEGIRTPVSERWPISVVPDRAPEVAFVWPGHDRPATSIEEVGLQFEASDDYGVKAITLSHAINGGPFVQTVVPGTDSGTKVNGTHTFYLEELRAPGAEQGSKRLLKPGDIVAFYAEATDHAQSERTALYFVEVRPFDRLYREAEQGAGNAGGGQGGLEVGERQREIVTATWNLINSTRGKVPGGPEADQTQVLAVMQRRLKTQVETLIERAVARGDSRPGDAPDPFVEELRAATLDMEPAAAALERAELESAISPEQQALQHLLAAEASIRDVDVSFGQSEGGRGTSGRALDELVELEMDPERNRYEVPETPDFGESESMGEDDWRKLEELAARQEQLADARSQQDDDPISRWQQQRLRRELEEMRDRMAAQQQQQRQSRGGREQSSAGSEQSPASQLSDAIETINRSLDGDSSRDVANNSEMRRAPGADEAGQILKDAARGMRERQTRQLADKLNAAADDVDRLLVSQRQTRERLDELGRETREAVGRGEDVPYYDFSMEAWSETKRRMQEGLNDVTGDVETVRRALESQNPDAARMLRQALDDIGDESIDGRLAYAAAAFELGRPLLAGSHESIVERALEQLGERLNDTRDVIVAGAGEAGDALSQVRDLRAALNDGRAGALNEGSVRAVGMALDQLLEDLPEDLAADLDTTLDRDQYVARGIAEDNSAALYQMMADRLDLLETALDGLTREPIRAQAPRDVSRESSTASRYFIDLSRTPVQE